MKRTQHSALLTLVAGCRRESTPEPCLRIELESDTQTLVLRLSVDAALELRSELAKALSGD